MILAELNTHRMFSRNSASSRAIPFKKMVKSVEENPFIPIAWQKDHKGMQGTEYFKVPYNEDCTLLWLEARDEAVKKARELNEYGVTKQLCNRLLEPFMWHTVLITSSEEGLENFFNLRCPYIYHAADGNYYKSNKDWNEVDKEIWYNGLTCLHPENKSQAEIHIQTIAELMWDAYNESKPKQLEAGQWHIPFEDKILMSILDQQEIATKFTHIKSKEVLKLKIATGMAARVSYTIIGDEKEVSYETLINIHDKMLEAVPFHASPFEHCAKAMSDSEYKRFGKVKPHSTLKEGKYNAGTSTESGWCRNFRGFIQYRELIEQ